MNLLGLVLDAANGDALAKLSNQFDLSTDQTSSVLSKVLPELTDRIQSNVQQENGLESLIGALTKGNHQRYVDDLALLSNSDTVSDGNNILGHLLSSKENSRQLASDVEASTGVSSNIIKKMLPVAATMVMGAISKNTQSGGLLEQLSGSLFNSDGDNSELLGSLLGSLSQGDAGTAQSNPADLVGGLLKNFLK